MNALNWQLTRVLWNLWFALMLFGDDEAPKRYFLYRIREIAGDIKQRVEAQMENEQWATDNPELYAEQKRVEHRTRMYGER